MESNVATRPARPIPRPAPRHGSREQDEEVDRPFVGCVCPGLPLPPPPSVVWTSCETATRGPPRPARHCHDPRAPGLPACATCRAGSAPFPHSGSGRGVIYPPLTHRAGTPGTPCCFGSKYFEKAPPPPLPSASRSDPSERNHSWQFEAASPCELRDFPEVVLVSGAGLTDPTKRELVGASKPRDSLPSSSLHPAPRKLHLPHRAQEKTYYLLTPNPTSNPTMASSLPPRSSYQVIPPFPPHAAADLLL